MMALRNPCVAALALACSCATPQWLPLQPVTAAAVAAGSPVVHETGTFRGVGGIDLFEQSWHPTVSVRGVLVIHHGLKDYSARYGEFATRLAARGYAVYAYDMRGHGRSAGARATLDNFSDLAEDLATFMARVRAREPGAPVFLLGHSVGGAVVTLYTLERRPELAGLITMAPALRVSRMPFEAAATPLVGALAPNLPLVDVPDRYFTRSPDVLREMGADPFVYHPAGPARTGLALLSAIERIWARADTLDVPLLGMHGTGDLATDPRGTADLVRRARTRDTTLLLYRGLYHDLIHEPEREQVVSDFERWIEAHTPPPH